MKRSHMWWKNGAAMSVLLGALLCASSLPADDEAARGGEEQTPATVWEGFVEHLGSIGKSDLLPAAPGESDEPSETQHTEHGHPLPDLSEGDPILGILFRLSNDLINLHALFTEEERAKLDSTKWTARVEKLVNRLREEEDPYLKVYGEFFGARLALEREEFKEAAARFERLLQSPRFLPRGEAHRSLAEAYRGLGEETLAILELQFFLMDLPREATADRLWAQDELREIREHHEGPLHDCADRARSISTLIGMKKVGESTQGKQRQVEDILEKVAKLLENHAGRCQNCGQQCDKKTGQCKSACKMCGACKGGSSSGSGNTAAGKSAGQCPNPGCPSNNGKGAAQGSQANGGPAQDTRMEEDQAVEPQIRDATEAEKEAWGRINDRDVARSLRRLWGKIPPSYRRLVAEYFKDITDLVDPEEKPAGEKK